MFLLTGGCSPSTLEDFQHEGEAECRKLVDNLSTIHTRDDLLKMERRLKNRFERLVDLMIAARKFQEEHSEEKEIDPALFDHPSNDALQEELLRIYAMEGGREIIERAQSEALIRLDSFEHNVARQKKGNPKSHK